MKKQTQRAIGILLVIVLAGSAIAAGWIWGRQELLPDGLILTNGRIEGDQRQGLQKMCRTKVETTTVMRNRIATA